MVLSIILILLILVIMIVTIYFSLNSILSSVNEKGREYFTLRLTELDKKRNKNLEEEEKEDKKRIIRKVVSGDAGQSKDSVVLYQSKNVNEFNVSDVLQFIKRIDSKFTYDDRYIVEEFVNQTTGDENIQKYNSLSSVKKYIEKIGLYKLLTNSEEEMREFKNNVNKLDGEVLSKYEKINGFFDIENFVDYLDIEIRKNDPTIYVLVGNKNVSFNDVSNRVKTMYREEVYRGVKIIYKGNIYDYSLG